MCTIVEEGIQSDNVYTFLTTYGAEGLTIYELHILISFSNKYNENISNRNITKIINS